MLLKQILRLFERKSSENAEPGEGVFVEGEDSRFENISYKDLDDDLKTRLI